MKKLFVLTTILALGAISTFAQGLINAGNQGTTTAIQVQNPNINSGVAVKIGTPASALFGTAVGKGAVTIAMYAAVNGSSTAVLESSQSLIYSGLNSASGLAGNQGTWVAGANSASFPLPTAAGMDGSAPVEFALYGSAADGSYTGWSNVGVTTPTTTAAASTGTLPISIYGGTGITTFILVPAPEPATIALGGLGAAALLLFRRRK